MAAAIRGHWSVENHLHWTLDAEFDEDAARDRAGRSAESSSRLRRIGPNLLNRDKSKERGVKGKQLNAVRGPRLPAQTAHGLRNAAALDDRFAPDRLWRPPVPGAYTADIHRPGWDRPAAGTPAGAAVGGVHDA